MRTYSFQDALVRHPELIERPVHVSALQARFSPDRTGWKSLLIRMGPFVGATDGFQFRNGFPITAEVAERYVALFEDEAVEAAVQFSANLFSDALYRLSIPVPIPFVPDISLPEALIDGVMHVVTPALNEAIAGLISSPADGTYGRCGGMAFAAYDFYLDGRPANVFGNTRPPDGSALDEYILDRLIDSLRLNATKFLEWLAILKVLPAISQLATTTLLTLAGSFAFPVGAAVGAFIGSQTDIFDLGGADKLRSLTLTELETLKARLDEQAGWPIGLIFGNTSNPFDQHQLLAIGYDVVDSDNCEVKVWDNRDSNGLERTMRLDTSGDELEETGVKDLVKGVFVEEYKPIRPPPTLKP